MIVEHALAPHGWVSPARLEIGSDGVFTAIEAEADGTPLDVHGYVLPSIPNVHGHAFQRAMAGHTETRSADVPHDTFWTWRKAMYELAAKVDTTSLEAIAAWLFVEMLESGTTSCAEFHYLHHDASGRRPEDRAAYSRAILRAAARTGIAVTLLPVLYMHGGFGTPLEDHQRRFGHDTIEEFAELHAEAGDAVRITRDAELGLAFHSVRAVRPDAMHEALERLGTSSVAVHVHVAEQVLEVEDCIAATGRRPLQLLLDEKLVDARTCLVHATHLDRDEIVEATRVGAIAGLCPTTEANLGDGIFPLPEWLSQGGAIALGSDSHVSVDPLEEMRLLEYGQRLARKQRAVAASPSRPHVGRVLWEDTCRGGAKALGQNVGALEPGRRADFVVLDAEHPRLLGHGTDTVCDAAVFSRAGSSPVRDVWVGGRRVVEDSRHAERDTLLANFRSALATLGT